MVFSKLLKVFKRKLNKPKSKISKKPVKKTPKSIKLKVRKSNNAKKVIKKVKVKKEEPLAVAIHYFSHLKVAVIKLKSPLKVGDKIRFKGFTTNFTQVVKSMQIEHEPILVAKKGQEIGLKVLGKVRHKDKVFKA